MSPVYSADQSELRLRYLIVDVLQDADGDWYAPQEMDGVTVAKAIRKMDNARKAYNARDGRDCYTFPQRNDQTTAQYVAEFCRANNLLTQEAAQ